MSIFNNAFLNWDHEVESTSLEDLAYHVACNLRKRAGWSQVAVEATVHGLVVLVVKTATFGRDSSFGASCAPHWERVLHLTGRRLEREVTGRASHFFSFDERIQFDEAHRSVVAACRVVSA